MDKIVKKCSKCKTSKDAKIFYLNKSARDGLDSWCKDCVKKMRKIYEQEKDRTQDIEYIYNKSKAFAKRRKLEFGIVKEDFAKFRSCGCHYCSSPITSIGTGLDRIDNNKGYIVGNVLPCCKTCNSIRGNKLTTEEMSVAMTAIIEFRKNQ